ncbi:MAG: hypothetical protein ACXWNX_17345, partial [Isosphaeraceae bacterium]
VCEAQADILTKDKTSGLVDIAADGPVDSGEFQLRARSRSMQLTEPWHLIISQGVVPGHK